MSLRSPPNEEGIHMSLQKMADIARKVGGEAHGLRYILLPVLMIGFSSTSGCPNPS